MEGMVTETFRPILRRIHRLMMIRESPLRLSPGGTEKDEYLRRKGRKGRGVSGNETKKGNPNRVSLLGAMGIRPGRGVREP
jgi:hypothetical protein